MIYGFKTDKVPELSQVGGKAKALIEMTKAGFRVPEGCVLSVEFFEPWINELKSTREWTEFLNSPQRDTCDSLKRRAGELRFTDNQKRAVHGELKGLSENSFFAVRSSSPEEDLKDASFAGQYETILGVLRRGIEKAVLEAFVSMLDIRVVEYKKINKLPIHNPRIAVIIQKQIASEVSGVAFSLNPKNNCYDETLINASFGLGESIVSGAVTPDTYTVEKIKGEILEKNIGEKETALWLKAKGGTIEKEIPNKKDQALTDEMIMKVSNLAGKCEKHYEVPMDIEWAVEEGRLYLLQARPITTYLHIYDNMLTKPGAQKNLYVDLVVLTQGFSENFSVLGLDAFGELLDVIKGGLMPVGKNGVVLLSNGREYMHISNMIKGYGLKKTKQLIGSYEKPLQAVFNKINLSEEYTPEHSNDVLKNIKKETAKMLLSALPNMIRAARSKEKALEIYNEVGDKFFDYCINEIKNDRPFDEVFYGMFEKLGEITNASMVIPMAMLKLEKIKKMFKGKWVDDEIQALSMDLPTNPTSAMGHAMFKLASFEEVQKTESAKEFKEKIEGRKYSREFMKTYDEYIVKYGARGFKEIDIATPRIYEKIEEFFIQLKSININDNQILTVKERKEKSYKKLLAKAKEIGKEKSFVKCAEYFNETMGLREHPKYLYVVATGQMRKVALEVGERFVAEGRLEKVEQIFDLHVREIAEAQKNPNMELMKLVRRNTSQQKLNEHIKEWPKIIDSRGKIFRYIRESEEGDLVGDAISPGTIRGRAKVLSTPYEKPLEKGEILVTRATEPAWTPIFVNASGVVLEIGGHLQHGAVIAREYGIPCVSGIFEGTKIIKDGDLLEVDGSSGIVKIIK